MTIRAVSEAPAHLAAPTVAPLMRRSFFAFFILSGFCSILYEVIWLRLAMAHFGVTTAMTSIVLSVFMAGLGMGSWAAGRLTSKIGNNFPRLWMYALAELMIGVGSLAVPYEFEAGRKLLETAVLSSSGAYYVFAGVCVAVALLPWCTCMGATFPLAMSALEEQQDDRRTFSYLYVANVLGALCGAVLPLFLIELLGFRGTLRVGGFLNLSLALWAFSLGARASKRLKPAIETHEKTASPPSASSRFYLLLLFATGLTSMGMEVVWFRLFTPYLGTEVYAFAAVLGIYLGSTFLGSLWYRRSSSNEQELAPLLWAVLGLAGLLPLFTADPLILFRSGPTNVLRAVIGIAPFAGLLGFLTPMLVDRVSGGHPDKAGSAYATNVIGCILGPLVSGFLLLPNFGERGSLGILVAFWVPVGGYFALRGFSANTLRPRLAFAGTVLGSVALLGLTHDYESLFKEKIVLRDNTATVIATTGSSGKQLLVNGVGITQLTPITKVMAHLPLAFLDRPPERALDICFGMGTTYRSLLSWGIHADAAELVPSVPKVFYYFHSDADKLLALARGHVIVDDGRRWLERTQETYDVITIDPPPPVEAAGSSLLYSKEFYVAAKRRLRPGGILAQWLPGGKSAVQSSVAQAIRDSFAYVRVFGSMEGWGFHFLASDSPIPARSAEELADRLPVDAGTDLVEWGPGRTPAGQLSAVLRNEISVDDLIRKAPTVPAMTDDRAVNEYYLLRKIRRK